ncbi:MAG: glycosyltransferase [Lachnospiraceae bacterium]|nr:glycosyltransferase [Lachnospiraceae bacterium]
MKRVLHISKYYYPFMGGTEQIAQYCVNSLKGDYDQKVICFNHENGDRKDFVDEIEVFRCGCIVRISSQSISLSYGKYLKTIFSSFHPDIVIFHYPNPFVAGILLGLISKKTKLIVYWHLDIVKQKFLRRFFVSQNIKLIKRADLLIATSPKYVDGSPYLKSAIDKCLVIPNCINAERHALTDQILKTAGRIRSMHSGKIICLAVGRHIEYKGFKYLIRASRHLDDRFEIYLAGEGEETKRLKKEASGDDKIHFLGAIDDDELKAYFSAMDIFCFPSITKNEAFGLALAEAMFYGKPAVTFTIPDSGVNYVCLNGEDGIEVQNRNVDAYAAALTMLADDPQLRKQMGENARNRVINNFLDDQFSENIKNAVKNLR